MRRGTSTRLIVIMVLTGSFLGCRNATPPATLPPDPQAAASTPPASTTTAGALATADALWQAAQAVLRDRGFRFAQCNARQRRITTFPVVSGHFFEFWRHDVANLAGAVEASIQHVRRYVEVSINPDGSGHPLDVRVFKQRFSAPERQFNSSASAYHIFSEQLPAARTGARIRANDETWIDAGRDRDLERVLTNEIISTAAANHMDHAPRAANEKPAASPA